MEIIIITAVVTILIIVMTAVILRYLSSDENNLSFPKTDTGFLRKIRVLLPPQFRAE